MGALTSKPYAFTARPWELRSFKGVDCFDSLGSSIRIDLRGLEIMRILPRINESLNEEWITDRVRFSYDALRKQRITAPLLKKSKEVFSKIDWAYTYAVLIKRFLLNKNFNSLNFLVGNLVNFNSYYTTLAFLKQVKRLLNISNLNIYSSELANSNKSVLRYRSNYLLNDVERLKSSDVLFTLNLNLRLCSPLLNIRVRKAVANNTLKVFNWGVQNDWTYAVVFLGGSFSILNNLIQGRHPLSKFLSKSIKPFLLYSSLCFRNRSLSSIVLKLSDVLKTNLFNLSSLHMAQTMSGIMAFDYGVLNSFFNSKNLDKKHISSSWILADDEICFDNSNLSFSIYSGHHGDRNALVSDLVLPTPYSLENRNININLLGHIQHTELVANPPMLARTHFSYLNGLFLVFKSLIGLPKSSIDALNNFTVNALVNNYLGFINASSQKDKLISTFLVSSSVGSGISGGMAEINFASSYNISYYGDNAVLRSSHVMALSMNRFQRYTSNFS
jgi:NADH-quinone oxidoreductase subunit G